jgi:hypothetical protein
MHDAKIIRIMIGGWERDIGCIAKLVFGCLYFIVLGYHILYMYLRCIYLVTFIFKFDKLCVELMKPKKLT